MKHLPVFGLIMFLLLLATTASAQIIIPPDTQPGVFTDPDWLKIDYQRVNVDISNQIASTHVDMQFTNQGNALAEGTFIFPLPAGAAVSNLTMWVDGEPFEAKILEADEARGIYDAIVRQYRDPALLEYIGTGAIQANVFPIPPGDSRRIEITYGQVLEADNGLLHYVYPLHTAGTGQRVIDQMSISVRVSGADPIASIYSPSHRIAVTREGDTGFRAGFETNAFYPDTDFSLYYGIAADTINLNLLTYRASATEDGFFMLLVQPPLRLSPDDIIAKDVIVVLDQSGSMDGVKWDQAREAAAYVLENLQSSDRFNIVSFSTGWRVYSPEMEPASRAQPAIDWLNTLFAEGGTDINGALQTALDMVRTERPTTILFLTDGLATEGETDTASILANLARAARPNARVFTFGVGDDVDTILLDSIVRDFRGTGSYVRPGERIDEEVASLYNKISAPVLTDVALDFGGAVTELLYPQQLSDLFAGEQLTLVGRYRGQAEDIAITLSGSVAGEARTFRYDNLDFPAQAGGDPFIARLWATRRIGDLLNAIRLNGENPELIESIINLSVRYGIITPYTSFLIEEDDILSQRGRDEAAAAFEAEELGGVSGRSAVDAADASAGLQAAEAPAMAMTATPLATQAGPGAPNPAPADDGAAVNPIQTVNDKTFILRDGVWIDTSFDPDTMTPEPIPFLSDAYFDLLNRFPALGDYLALGERVIVVYEGTVYEITPAA